MQTNYIHVSRDMVPLKTASRELGRNYRAVYHQFEEGRLNAVVQRVGKQLLVKTDELAMVLSTIEALKQKRRGE